MNPLLKDLNLRLQIPNPKSQQKNTPRVYLILKISVFPCGGDLLTSLLNKIFKSITFNNLRFLNTKQCLQKETLMLFLLSFQIKGLLSLEIELWYVV
jgi:hypothetical protein